MATINSTSSSGTGGVVTNLSTVTERVDGCWVDGRRGEVSTRKLDLRQNVRVEETEGKGGGGR